MASATNTGAVQHGIVKSVQSGDSIIVRGQPKGGPPPEKQINLAYVMAAKISRKLQDGTHTVDEPFAWEAREYLRKKLIGKEITFRVEYKLPFGGGQRECALVYLNGESINDTLVSEGLVEVVKRAQNKENPEVIRLIELEDVAKTKALGKWSSGKVETLKRTLQQEVENGQALVGKTYDAIVEHVRDGSTLRVGLFLPNSGGGGSGGGGDQPIIYQMITLQLSGVRCPQTSEPFGEEARFFTETRLLQRDVKVRLEQFNTNNVNFPTFVGTVTFMSRDIAEYLLREGYAKTIDWTIALVADPKKLRTCEREAKQKRLRLWRDLKEATATAGAGATGATGGAANRTGTFDAKVLEIVNADALVVQKVETKEIRKIFLSSIRPPRSSGGGGAASNTEGGDGGNERKTPFRPLYDIPFMFEAREFLRKRLIGKTVKVHLDYVQPKSDAYPEKVCCTVTQDGVNIAEQLILKGLATVVRYRNSDNEDSQRSPDYDSYLSAELKAQKMNKGLYSNKPDAGMVRIVDLSADVTKSKSFAPFLTKTGLRREALVEYVFPSSTKLKLYIPKESCLINLNLAGVNMPKQTDPLVAESVQYAKMKVYQRDVLVEIETQDKAGNYIGTVYFDKNHSLATELVRAGYLSVREYTNKQELINAETEAKQARKGIWKDWQPEVEQQQQPLFDDGEANFSFDDGDENSLGAAASAGVNGSNENGTNGDGVIGATGASTAATAAAATKAPGVVDDIAQRRKVVITNLSTTFTTFHAQEVADGVRIEELLTRLREEVAQNPPLGGLAAASFKPKRGELVIARFSEDRQWYRARVEKSINASETQVLYIDYGNREVLPNTELAPLPPGANYSSSPPGAKEYQFAYVFPDTDPENVDDLRAEFMSLTDGKVLLLKVEYKDATTGLDAATLVDESSKKDIVLGLVYDGWLFVDTKTRRTGRLYKKWQEYKEAQETAKKSFRNLWQFGDVSPDDHVGP